MTDDRNAIVDVLNLYALAVDTQNWALFDQVFTPDVLADYPSDLLWHDLDAFKRDFHTIHDHLRGSMHVITNHQVRIDGDTAHALSYGHFRLFGATPEGQDDFWEAIGWYDDHLVRTTAGWRIDRRRARVTWYGGNPAVLKPLPNGAAPDPKMSLRTEAAKDDIAYLKLVRR